MNEFTTAIWAARAARLGITIVSAVTGGVKNVWTGNSDAWLVTLSCNGKQGTFVCYSGLDTPTAGEVLESIVDDIRMMEFDEYENHEERRLKVRSAREIKRMRRELKRLIGPREYDAMVDLYYDAFHAA